MTKEELQTLTVRDVILQQEFKDYVQAVMDMEIGHREKMQRQAIAEHRPLGRTVVDNLMEKDAWNADKIVDCFGAILDKSCIGLSASEREYIHLLGMNAFNRTMQMFRDTATES